MKRACGFDVMAELARLKAEAAAAEAAAEAVAAAAAAAAGAQAAAALPGTAPLAAEAAPEAAAAAPPGTARRRPVNSVLMDFEGMLMYVGCKRLSKRKMPGTRQFKGSKARQADELLEGLRKVLAKRGWGHLLDDLVEEGELLTFAIVAAAYAPGKSTQLVVLDLYSNESAHESKFLTRKYWSETNPNVWFTGADLSEMGVAAAASGNVVILGHPTQSRFVRAPAAYCACPSYAR